MCVLVVNGIFWNFFYLVIFCPAFRIRVTYEQRSSDCVSFWSYWNIFVILQTEYLFMNLISFSNVLFYLRISNQQDASGIQNFILSRNSTCFGQLLCPSSGVISCTRGNWYVSCRLCGRCLAESGCSITVCHLNMQVVAISSAVPYYRRAHLAIQLFQPDSDRQRPHNLHETYQLPRVQLITPDDGHRSCPKHVEFRDKIKIGYLMHLVGYLYEDYQDARSHEHKVLFYICFSEKITHFQAHFNVCTTSIKFLAICCDLNIHLFVYSFIYSFIN